MTSIAPDAVVPFKQVTKGGAPSSSCELKVWLPKSASGPVPVFYWIHGGGFIDGDAHDSSDAQLVTAVQGMNWAFVAVNYRLAPQARMNDILEDVEDGWKFTHSKLDAALGGNKLDTHKCILAGASAGGFLSVMSLPKLSPKPKAMFLLYPLTDFTHATFSAKVPFPNPVKLADVEHFLAEDGPVVTGSRADVDFATMTPRGRTAATFYALQEGQMADYILPKGDSTNDWSIEKRLGSDTQIPPTVIIHGKDDLMVPYETATSLESKLKALGASRVELFTLENANHGWDLIPGADTTSFKQAYETLAVDI